MPRHAPLTAALSLLALAFAAPVGAQSPAFTTPHWTREAGAVTVQWAGQTYVNQGLVGVGRLPADTRDFNGDTLGSFSGMALDLSSWRKAADGTYSGVLFTLPDRGPNNVGSVTGTSDYPNRLVRHEITFKPYAASAPLAPAATQLQLKPSGGMILKDETGQRFTGDDPGAGVVSRGGIAYPSPQTGTGAGRISMDSEGLALLPDGGFYISDEYAPGLYLFDKTGRQIGAIQAPPALLPRTGGKVDFNAKTPPTTGRRNNQGLEAVAVSPDGTRLITILQSATLQDSGSDKAMQNNTRILVYDISKTRTPSRPIAHYVLQLPIYRTKGDGKPANATAAQSEMVALSDTRFLVLSRDSNGRGKESPDPPVFKSILLVDTAGATNLAGTAFEQDVKPVADKGALVAGIAPVKAVELVNILNPVQLAKFGMNLDTAPSTPFSLPEKIEAMTLAPALDPKAPNDVFLLVGDDNDFETAKGMIAGQPFDAGLTNKDGSGSGDNANLILVYRLTLPAAAPAKP